MLGKLLRIWTVVSIIVVVLVSSFAHGQQPGPSQTGVGIADNILDILKVAGGFVGLLFGAIGAIAYWRVMVKTGAEKAYKATIGAQSGQIEAMTKRIDSLVDDYRLATSSMSAKDALLVELKGKTDITAVLNTLNEFVKSSESRHVETNRVAAERYSEGMKLMQSLLEHISNEQKLSIQEIKANHEVLAKLVTSSEGLSRRFGEIEDRVLEVGDQLGIKPASKEREERRSRHRP